jgi:hypothetical protein
MVDPGDPAAEMALRGGLHHLPLPDDQSRRERAGEARIGGQLAAGKGTGRLPEVQRRPRQLLRVAPRIIEESEAAGDERRERDQQHDQPPRPAHQRRFAVSSGSLVTG